MKQVIKYNQSITLKEDIKNILKNREIFNELKSKTVLVTGATGLIGSMIIRTLVEENEINNSDIEIIGQARNKDKVKILLGEILNRKDIRMIYTDSFDIDVDCDYIIHTACPTTSKYFINYPVETIDVSLNGTRKMLELSRQNKVKSMVYLSSMEEYGEPFCPGEIMSEDKCGFIDNLSIRSCYPESKRMSECYCASYVAEYGIDVKIARLAQTFGAGVPMTDNRVFMQFARSVIEKKDIILHTEGKSVSNFCYLSDAIEGIFTIMLKGKSGEAYNVCNDKETRSIIQIAKMITDEIANNSIKIAYDLSESLNNSVYAPDVTLRLCSNKLSNIGWVAKVDMKEAYCRLINYIKEVV